MGVDEGVLTFQGWLPARSLLLVAPLFLALASLPWWAATTTDPSPTRIAASGVALAVAVACAVWSWPRRLRLGLDPARAELRVATSVLRLGENARLRLSAEMELDSPRTLYGVEIETGSAGRHALLVDSDPARLLRELHGVLALCPLPVECQWGLPASAQPWVFELHEPPDPALDRASAAAGVAVGTRHAGPGLITCLVIIAAFLSLDMSFLVITEGAQVGAVHPLSVALPLLVSASLVALSWGVGTLEEHLVIGSRLTARVRAFGRSRTVSSVPFDALRGVYVVGSSDAERGHVLLDSTRGPLAISASRYDIQALAERIRRALATSPARLGVTPE